MSIKEKHLYFLSELSDYKMESNYPNVSGWKVKDSALRTIGEVKNLLVNLKSKRVVYLDVEVDASIIDAGHDPYGPALNPDLKEFINAKGENHLIIPIGLVELNETEKYVFTDTIDHQTFSSTKRIRENTQVDRDYEKNVLHSYGRKGSTTRVLTDSKPQDSENKSVILPAEEGDKNDFYARKEFDDSKLNKR